MNCVSESLALRHFVRRRTGYLTHYSHARLMNADEDYVAVEKPHVVSCISCDQIIIDVEYVDSLSAALDLDVAQCAVVRRSLRRVQRIQRSRCAGYPVAAG